MSEFHFLRPIWFFTFIPLALIIIRMLTVNILTKSSWKKICDPELLEHFIVSHGKKERVTAIFLFAIANIFIIIALAGPTWNKKEAPVYKPVFPHVIVVDMSQDMFERDLTPNRLIRAKFKLHELFKHEDAGQFAMIVYTDEPFVVSPLTEDAKTIDSLLPAITREIMPIDGQNLEKALLKASNLINQAGFYNGSILVLTASAPTESDINFAKKLTNQNISTSLISVMQNDSITEKKRDAFKRLAKSGNGYYIPFTNNKDDIEQWLQKTNKKFEIKLQSQQSFTLWKDEGRWFLIPALLCLLPMFIRGWLQRVKI